jgi:hypothetical protein
MGRLTKEQTHYPGCQARKSSLLNGGFDLFQAIGGIIFWSSLFSLFVDLRSYTSKLPYFCDDCLFGGVVGLWTLVFGLWTLVYFGVSLSVRRSNWERGVISDFVC